MLSSQLTSADSAASAAGHRSLPAVLASLAVTLVLAPLAYRQFGPSGLLIVSSFGAAMIASVWLAAWGAARLSRNHEPVAKLFASSGVRMVAPLIIAVAVVAAGGRIAPVELVYYVLPMYLCMLVVDVVGWAREAKVSGRRAHTPARSVASGEGG